MIVIMNFGGTLKINKFSCFCFVFTLFVIIYWRSGHDKYPSENGDLINLKHLLKAAIQAAERGGKKVIEGQDRELHVKSKGKTLEGANDPVTDADYASHCAMYYSLRHTFPNLAIISEEHSKEEPSCVVQDLLNTDTVLKDHTIIEYMNDEYVYHKDVTIWIDPLDATQEYTEALYQYVTTMVCVAIRGVPIIGVIHYPFTPQTYWGWFTKKTSSNIAAVPHQEENKQHPRVVVSRSHPGEVAEMAIDAFGSGAKVTTAAGAGFKIMGVVNGTYDMYLHATVIKKWDLCAGDAILRAVDGKLTTAHGQYIDYSASSRVQVTDGVVATRYDHDYYMMKLKKVVNAIIAKVLKVG